MTSRWKITVEYDGTPFCGWQRQDNVPSIQQSIEDAIFAFSSEHVTLHTAGRTDAGVHAVGQVAHFDLDRDTEAKTIRDAINAHLRPHPIAIVQAEPVSTDFHARYTATKRTYCYHITASRMARAILDDNRVWQVRGDLDIAAMQAGAKHLIGKHDFTSFRATNCQANSPVRSIERLDVILAPHYQTHGQHIEIWVEARSFLHHQVRNIAGTLKLVGEGNWTPDDVKSALDACDRTKGGPTAPAQGLCFVKVEF